MIINILIHIIFCSVILFTVINLLSLNDRNVFQASTLRIPDTNVPSKMIYSMQIGNMTTNANYWIIDNNDNYSVIFSCSATASGKRESIWILSRTPTLESNSINTVKLFLLSYGVEIQKFIISDQSNCIY